MKHALFTLLLMAAVSGTALDQVTSPGGKAVEGYFIGFERGVFKFMDAQKKTLRLQPSSISKLTLDKPLKARLENKSKRGDMKDVTLAGFENGQFVFEGTQPKLPLYQVAVLRVDSLDAGRSVDDLDEDIEIISRGETVDVSAAAVTGKVTVIHFHAPGVVSSERQGGFLLRKASESNGRIIVKRVIVPDNSPVARQYQLNLVPQFWFYDKSGRISSKLSQRFLDQDLLDAIRKAGGP